MTIRRSVVRSLFALLAALALAAATSAQKADLTVLNPSNSGVPGEEIRSAQWAPDGTLWVAARWPFWGDAGIGVWDPELETWSVWTNWETPLPSQFIGDIEFDPDGVAWIATDGGLVRWDGETWTVYDSSNTPMELDKIADLSIAPNGHIWINNSDFNAGGDAIWHFDGISSWTDYRVPDELPWDAPWTDLSHVFVASNGHVWVANDTLPGVAEFDGTTWIKRGVELGKLDEMAEDQFGNIWINGHGIGGPNAYFRWDGSAFATYPITSPQTLVADPEDGTIYAGNWHGEVQRTSDGGASVEVFVSGLNQVFAIAPDPAGEDVWIGTIGAVGHFRGDGSWVRDFNSWNSSLPFYFIDRFTTDRDGYLWVATHEAGLSRFDGARWRNWGNHNAGSEPYPFAGNEPMGSAFLDSSGRHWFGGNGIARWDDATGEFTGFWNWENNPGMGVGLWIFFAEDAAGDVFAVEEFGSTYRFDEASQLWLQEPVQPYAVSGIPGVASDSQGNVWIGGWFDIYKWDGTSWSVIELPYTDYFFDLGGISSFEVGPDDTLWAGTVEGLVRYDGVDFTLFDTSNSPLRNNHVRALDVRSDGALGLATLDYSIFSGAAAFVDGDITDPANWSTWIYPSDGLPHWQLEAAGFAPDGDLWIGATSEGAAVIAVGERETLALAAPQPAAACVENSWIVTGANPGATVHLLRATTRGSLALPGCAGVELGIEVRGILGTAVADVEGVARFNRTMPCRVQGRESLFQAAELARCAVSAVVQQRFE